MKINYLCSSLIGFLTELSASDKLRGLFIKPKNETFGCSVAEAT